MSSWTRDSSPRPPLNPNGALRPPPPPHGQAGMLAVAAPHGAQLQQRPHSVAVPPGHFQLPHMGHPHDRGLFGRASGIAQTRPGDDRPRPNPSSISTSDDAIEALSPPAPFDPLYAEAVLLAYGRAKRGRFKGRSDDDVNAKLDALEQRLPRYYADSFAQVRDKLGLRGGASELRVTPFFIPPPPSAQPAVTPPPPQAAPSAPITIPDTMGGPGSSGQSILVPGSSDNFRPSSAPTRTGSWPRRNGNILPVSQSPQIPETPEAGAAEASAEGGTASTPVPASQQPPAQVEPPPAPTPPAASRPRVRRRSTDIVTDLPPAYAMVEQTGEARPARPVSVYAPPVAVSPRPGSGDAPRRSSSSSNQHRLSQTQLTSSPPRVEAPPTVVRQSSGALETAAVASARAELESLALLEASRRREQETARREAELARREEERIAEDARRETERVRQEEERRVETARREAELARREEERATQEAIREAELARREDELRKREERAAELARREEELRRREERAEEREVHLKMIAEEASRERYEREARERDAAAAASSGAGLSRVTTNPERPGPSRQTTAPAAGRADYASAQAPGTTWNRRTSEPVSPTAYVSAHEVPPPPPPRPPSSAIVYDTLQPRLHNYVPPILPARPVVANGSPPPPIPARPVTQYVAEASPPIPMPVAMPSGPVVPPVPHPYVSPPLQQTAPPPMVSPPLQQTAPPPPMVSPPLQQTAPPPPMVSPPLQQTAPPPMVSPPLPPRISSPPMQHAALSAIASPPLPPRPAAQPIISVAAPVSAAAPAASVLPPPPSHPDTRPLPLPQAPALGPILPPPSHPGRAPATPIRNVPPLPPPPRSPNLPATTLTRPVEPPTPGPHVPGSWIDSPPLDMQGRPLDQQGRPLEQQARPLEQPARPLPTAPSPGPPPPPSASSSAPVPLLPPNLGLSGKGKAREQAFLKAMSKS